MTRSTGTSGLILSGSPPSAAIASRIAARSTTAGTPVKSCISTRAGRKAISCSVLPRLSSQAATASMSSFVTVRPSSLRSRFSSRTFIENGSCEMPASPFFSAAFSEEILVGLGADGELLAAFEAVEAGHAGAPDEGGGRGIGALIDKFAYGGLHELTSETAPRTARSSRGSDAPSARGGLDASSAAGGGSSPGLSFAVGAGEALVVTGPNGAGKSSLLRALCRVSAARSRRLALEGGDAERTVGEQAHYLGHADALKGALTAGENLDFWARRCSAAMLRASGEPRGARAARPRPCRRFPGRAALGRAEAPRRAGAPARRPPAAVAARRADDRARRRRAGAPSPRSCSAHLRRRRDHRRRDPCAARARRGARADARRAATRRRRREPRCASPSSCANGGSPGGSAAARRSARCSS